MAKTPGRKKLSRSAKERRKDQTAESIGERLAEQHRQRGNQREVERVVEDSASLRAEKEAAEEAGGSRQQRRALARRERKLERRTLRLLERDDELVREALRRKEKLAGIMGAEHATDADEMLWFLAEELKLISVLEELSPPETRFDEKKGKEVRRRTNYAPLMLNVLGILSRYLGLGSKPDIQALVFTDVRWMALLGFNATEVENGASRRSESLRGKTREGAGGRFVDADELGPVRTRLEGPRGALSSQTLEAHESALDAAALTAAFNTFVQALAARGVFAKEVRGALDSTGQEVVPSFVEAGVVRKKVKVESKARRPRQLEVPVKGFKLWYLMEVETGLPLAMCQASIETAETVPAKALIDQASENLKGHSRLVSLAIDRGFLDGDLLWWMKKERDVDWVCPSKENMLMTAEARERVNQTVASLKQGKESLIETAQRAARRGLSHDGVSFFEREVAASREPLVLAQVEELLDTDFYGPGGSSSSRVHSKKYRPTPLHATVVLNWPDRSESDCEDESEHDSPSKGPVVLISPVKESAFERFNRYDERSLIENRLNRDGKQHFALGTSLARTPQALWTATVFSTLALMLHRALGLHREQMAQEMDRRGEALGVLRYRRQQMLKNRGHVIVALKEHYGIFTFMEFASLAGFDFY